MDTTEIAINPSVTNQKRVYIESFGCQMNDLDMVRMQTLLKGVDYVKTDTPKDADLILVNTCSIRDKAEHKVYSTVGRFQDLKKENKNLIIGICGCVAQQEGESLLKRIPYLDLVVGTQNIQAIPQMVSDIREKKIKKAVSVERYNTIQADEFDVVPETENPFKANVSIMRGCDKVCTFCIVPRVRGREVCRTSSDILDEIHILRDRGVKEVTLIGQTVTSYSATTGGDMNFTELIGKVSEVDGIERVRFISPHPTDFHDELIEMLVTNDKICNAIHMPLQSGSNSVLTRMKRGYLIDEYMERIDKIKTLYKKHNKPISISTDMIVAFPGETDADFEETMKIVEEVRFDSMYSFTFSPRPRTVAESYVDTIDPVLASERLQILQKRQIEISGEKIADLKDTIQDVLVEGRSKHNFDDFTGRTDCNRVVNFSSVGVKDKHLMEGLIVKLKISDIRRNSLRGELLEDGVINGELCL